MDKKEDLHVSIHSVVARELSKVARARGIRRAELFRLICDEFLARYARERQNEEMRRYVEEMAPASREFVRETQTHLRQRLLRETEW